MNNCGWDLLESPATNKMLYFFVKKMCTGSDEKLLNSLENNTFSSTSIHIISSVLVILAIFKMNK